MIISILQQHLLTDHHYLNFNFGNIIRCCLKSLWSATLASEIVHIQADDDVSFPLR